MQSTITESTLVLSSKSLDELRSLPVTAPPLPASLQSIAEEVQVRARTELLATLLEREMDAEHAADVVCDVWRAARAGDRDALRCLMSLLEVRLSGLELLRRALAAKQLLRATRRAARGANEATAETWRETLEKLRGLAGRVGVVGGSLNSLEGSSQLQRRSASLLERLLAGRISEPELAWLVDFAELEMRATSLRLGDLAERVGACDGRRISQLLPVLSKEEERVRDTRAILLKLPEPEDLVRRTPVLVSRLEDRGFDGLIREIGRRPEGIEVARAMVLTTWRAPLAPELAFLAGIVRLLADRFRRPDAQPLDPARAVLLALMAHRTNGISADLTPMEIRHTRVVWEALDVEARPGGFRIDFDARHHEPLLPDDGVPELLYPAVRRKLDMRQLVLANIQNEHVICGLLQTPRVASLPGLVEAIVVRSRSLKVLLEIANRRELHTGAANRNVPRALLWHPSAIPVTALRKFVHVRFMNRGELVSLSGRGSRARPEVRQMAAAYLSTLTSG